jgi:hypothetical protein
MTYLDVGGGLGVDYDGSKTNFYASKTTICRIMPIISWLRSRKLVKMPRFHPQFSSVKVAGNRFSSIGVSL